MNIRILILFFIVNSFSYIFSENSGMKMNKLNMREWEEFIKSGNINAIDSMLINKVDFELPEEYTYEFKDDKKQDDIFTKIIYYCLRENMFLADRYHASNASLHRNKIGYYYSSGHTEHIYGNAIWLLATIERESRREFLNENKEKAVSKFQINIDSITSEVKSLEEENIHLLNVLKHILNKGYKLNRLMLSRLIYASTDWGVNPVSLIFLYQQLYSNPDYFEDNALLDYKPEKVLLSYVASESIDKDCLLYLIEIIDKTNIEELLEQMYPIRDIDEWDRDLAETVPSYEAEKVLLSIFPQMEIYSGHNLLYAAIVNVDIELVKRIIKRNSYLLDVKTESKHPYFYSTYGDTSLTPLQLAVFTKEQLEMQMEEDSSYRTLPYRFKLEQIKKIINILQGYPSEQELF